MKKLFLPKPEACNFIKKRGSGTGVFKISKNTFSYRTPPVAAFVIICTVFMLHDFNLVPGAQPGFSR